MKEIVHAVTNIIMYPTIFSTMQQIQISPSLKLIYASFGVCTTTKMYSLSGAIIISCFFDLTRKNANSSLSSNVRTTPAAFNAN